MAKELDAVDMHAAARYPFLSEGADSLSIVDGRLALAALQETIQSIECASL
jgi:hypothetical protein